MKNEILHQDDLFVIGMRIPLTSSLDKNQKLIQDFWKDFNRSLKRHALPMRVPWIKYGITLREDTRLYYLCAVPSLGSYPKDYELYRLPRGSYLQYVHNGAMSSLPKTIRRVWREELLKQAVTPLNSSLCYYEVYQEGFQFEQPTSKISLYIPIVEHISTDFPTIPAKTILTGSGAPLDAASAYKDTWFGMDFNMNLYKGCCHGCVYCDSRSQCYQVQDFDIVRGKQDALSLLEKELKRKRRKGTIGIGAMSDTYNPFERKQLLTRGALQLIAKYGYGVGIDTKSSLIVRDLDLLQQIAGNYPSIFKITITCVDDTLARQIEPYAPSSTERFEAVQTLSDAGLFTGILLMPILPFLNDTEENILGIIRKAHEHHARFIYVYGGFGLTLRDNQRDYFYHWLDQYSPNLRFQYERHFHKCYSCNSPHSKSLYQLFQRECQKYGILYRMSDIIQGYKAVIPNQQLSLRL